MYPVTLKMFEPHTSKADIIKQEKLRLYKESIQFAFINNQSQNKKGTIKFKKMPNNKKIPLTLGYINVVSNYNSKKLNQNYILNYKSLSPTNLGPVNHNMPNLPPSLNLENFWNFSKVWHFELDPETDMNELQPVFFQKRIKGYLLEKPIKSKYTFDQIKAFDGPVNPECAIYYDKYGQPIKYDYIQSRYFYCHYYQQLVSQVREFNIIKKKLQMGYNIIIYSDKGFTENDKYYQMYVDPTKPFKHEMILYIMLKEPNPDKYPWNIYYKIYRKIYQNVI